MNEKVKENEKENNPQCNCGGEGRANKPPFSKKTAVIIAVALVGAAVILALLNSIDYDAIVSGLFDKNPEMTFDYKFCEADYSVNILNDPEYLALDRSVYYTEGSVTRGDVDLDNYPGGAVVKDYLNYMIGGNADGYNALFSEEYYSEEGNDRIDRFPMQRLYNINVTLLQRPYVYKESDLDGKYTGITRYYFSVEYYIQYNTGTVRKDIPSDMSRPIYLEVFEYPDGSMKINGLDISGFSKG